MINKKTLEFLKWLEEFNDKKFFELYKPLYLEIKKDFDNFIEFLIEEISKFDENIKWLEVKKSVFRIYKDMRFPRNRERPYKTNLWAQISFWWKKSNYAWYYIHIQNNENFFSWWIYHPKTKSANKIRQKIYKDWDKFKKIINKKEFKKEFWFIESYNQKLKVLPKKFEKKQPSFEYLRHRDRLIRKKLNNKDVLSKNFWKEIIKLSKIAKDFNNFLNN